MSSIPTMRSNAVAADSAPLVVDLDGTLLKSDLLLESANQFVTHHPMQALRLLGWLAAGRSALKARLAEQCEFDASVLPYNGEVVDWLRQQKQQGRTLILATASHRRLAQAVATHLGLFDEVLGTVEGSNLKGEAKRDRLVERFGER